MSIALCLGLKKFFLRPTLIVHKTEYNIMVFPNSPHSRCPNINCLILDFIFHNMVINVNVLGTNT